MDQGVQFLLFGLPLGDPDDPLAVVALAKLIPEVRDEPESPPLSPDGDLSFSSGSHVCP